MTFFLERERNCRRIREIASGLFGCKGRWEYAVVEEDKEYVVVEFILGFSVAGFCC